MNVGAEHRPSPGALATVLAVVAPTDQTAAERLDSRAEVSPAGVVLEPDQGWRVESQPDRLHQHVPDGAARPSVGVDIQQPEARQLAAADRHVMAPEELIAAAH